MVIISVNPLPKDFETRRILCIESASGPRIKLHDQFLQWFGILSRCFHRYLGSSHAASYSHDTRNYESRSSEPSPTDWGA